MVEFQVQRIAIPADKDFKEDGVFEVVLKSHKLHELDLLHSKMQKMLGKLESKSFSADDVNGQLKTPESTANDAAVTSNPEA